MQVLLDNPMVLVMAAGVFAPLAGWAAARRSRSPAVWFVFGALLGPIALLLLALAPPGRCPACESPVPGWAGWCRRCGTRLPALTALLESAPPRRIEVAATSLGDAPDVRTDQPRPLDALVGRRSRRADRTTSRPPSRPAVRPALQPARDLPRETARPTDRALAEPTAGEVLSTGIYLSGNARLDIGACYALARVGERWRVFGPVDAGQITIRHEGDLGRLEVTAMDDRVILSAPEGRSSLAIVLRPIGGMRATDLERALSPLDGPPATGTSGASGVAS